MKQRVYVSVTVLLIVLSFSLSEAGSRYPGAGAPVGPLLTSGTIAAQNDPSIGQRMIAANSFTGNASTNKGKISDNESPRPQDRLKLPKSDPNQRMNPGKTQPGGQQSIFDRWGNN